MPYPSPRRSRHGAAPAVRSARPRSPWNAASPDAITYDVAALALRGRRPAICTFGGDRETFDFTDPTSYLRVDDEVWRFAPSGRER